MFFSLLLASFLTFVELNCENLFDCQHDSLKNDIEFTPDASRHWTHWKYQRKLKNISKEIIACGADSIGNGWPDLVALCEVENDSVVRDLTSRSLLRTLGYRYLITNSPDLRGIDVALLYHPLCFAPITHRSLRVTPLENMRPTRDILYVAGRISSGDTLHVFVVHAPSRFGGERATRPYRLAVAQRLCSVIDSVRSVSPQAKVIVAGDFNDGADDPALSVYYQKAMHNATRGAKGINGAEGTYRYKGLWGSLDHILVSEPLSTHLHSAAIFDAPFLLSEDEKYGGVKPRRSYYGFTFDPDGYSDHLPLVVRFAFPVP